MAHNNNAEDLMADCMNDNSTQNILQNRIDEALGNKPSPEVSSVTQLIPYRCIIVICTLLQEASSNFLMVILPIFSLFV